MGNWRPLLNNCLLLLLIGFLYLNDLQELVSQFFFRIRRGHFATIPGLRFV